MTYFFYRSSNLFVLWIGYPVDAVAVRETSPQFRTLLTDWSRSRTSTVGVLAQALANVGRQDIFGVLYHPLTDYIRPQTIGEIVWTSDKHLWRSNLYCYMRRFYADIVITRLLPVLVRYVYEIGRATKIIPFLSPFRWIGDKCQKSQNLWFLCLCEFLQSLVMYPECRLSN